MFPFAGLLVRGHCGLGMSVPIIWTLGGYSVVFVSDPLAGMGDTVAWVTMSPLRELLGVGGHCSLV